MDFVWARRPKPTRPAGAEHPPLSFGTPHAMQPQGSWSPDVRNVWSRRREAGLVESRTGCRMVISGRTCGDADAKSFYFFSKGSKPAATQGLPRGCESFSRRRKGTSRLFLSPPSFFFTHEKERWGAGGSQPRTAHGVVPRIPTLNPIGSYCPYRTQAQKSRCSIRRIGFFPLTSY